MNAARIDWKNRCVRVLHVIDSLGGGGGAEHALRVQLPELRKLGVDSQVVCLRHRAGPLASLVRSEGTPVTVLPPGGRLTQGRALREVIRHAEPDLVHATLFESCLLSRVATPRAVPLLNSLVSTSYARVRTDVLGAPRIRRLIVQYVDWATSRRVTHFHALTQAVRDEASRVLGISAKKVTVIPRGRSIAALGARSENRRTRVRAELDIDPAGILIINVGRQEPPKGQVELVKAFQRVLEELPTATLLIVGREGTSSAELSDTVQALRLADSVRVLGYRTDVPDLVAASDVFVFPSYYEGLGSALLEAMALETPILASDIPAVLEVLADGEAGRTYRVGQRDELAEALIDLASDPVAQSEYARRGLKRFRENYTLNSVVKQTFDLYQSLLPPRESAHLQ